MLLLRRITAYVIFVFCVFMLLSFSLLFVVMDKFVKAWKRQKLDGNEERQCESVVKHLWTITLAE